MQKKLHSFSCSDSASPPPHSSSLSRTNLVQTRRASLLATFFALAATSASSAASGAEETPKGGEEVEVGAAESEEGKGEVEEEGKAAVVEEARVKKVLVVGATGRTGKEVVRELVERGVRVRAGVRSLEKGEATFPLKERESKGIELVKADVTAGSAELESALDGVDAVIIATGFSPGLDPTAAWKVDNLGTVAVVEASKKKGVKRLVLVTSLLTNGAAWGQVFNPSYLLLNAFGLVLIAKNQAERFIEKSGINFTIVRPGGLKSDPPSGNILAKPADTLDSGSISRVAVAQVAVESLFWPEASYKTIEIISTPEAPKLTFQELFASVP